LPGLQHFFILSESVKQILRFLLLLLVQALVLSHMPPLHRFVTPYLYFVFLLWLPFSISRAALLILAFSMGFALDLFSKTPGLHASACLLVGYVRPFLINLLVPGDTKELTLGSPNIRSMGFASYAIFLVILTLLHHGWLVLVEWMYFGSLWYYLGKVSASLLVSLALILITELLFRPIRRESRRR
jgi:rod shape-determining protein MreD